MGRILHSILKTSAFFHFFSTASPSCALVHPRRRAIPPRIFFSLLRRSWRYFPLWLAQPHFPGKPPSHEVVTPFFFFFLVGTFFPRVTFVKSTFLPLCLRIWIRRVLFSSPIVESILVVLCCSLCFADVLILFAPSPPSANPFFFFPKRRYGNPFFLFNPCCLSF